MFYIKLYPAFSFKVSEKVSFVWEFIPARPILEDCALANILTMSSFQLIRPNLTPKGSEKKHLVQLSQLIRINLNLKDFFAQLI